MQPTKRLKTVNRIYRNIKLAEGKVWKYSCKNGLCVSFLIGSKMRNRSSVLIDVSIQCASNSLGTRMFSAMPLPRWIPLSNVLHCNFEFMWCRFEFGSFFLSFSNSASVTVCNCFSAILKIIVEKCELFAHFVHFAWYFICVVVFVVVTHFIFVWWFFLSPDMLLLCDWSRILWCFFLWIKYKKNAWDICTVQVTVKYLRKDTTVYLHIDIHLTLPNKQFN